MCMPTWPVVTVFRVGLCRFHLVSLRTVKPGSAKRGRPLASGVPAQGNTGDGYVKRVGLWPGGEAGQPVSFPQCQQPLGLGGPGVDCRRCLCLAVVNPVLVAAGPDL